MMCNKHDDDDDDDDDFNVRNAVLYQCLNNHTKFGGI